MKSLPADRPPGNRESRKPETSWRGVAIAGYILILLTFGVVGVWTVVAKIDRAVAAPGVVAIETNRKTVQHFEGGIVREVLVKEGERLIRAQFCFDWRTSKRRRIMRR